MSRKRRDRDWERAPDVLWRLFGDRARTLSDTIISLLPPPPPSLDLCRCKGRHCLGCTRPAMSFLLRPDDPSDYHKLLTKCFVVVSDNAPSLPFFIPNCHWSQTQIVKRTIELMLCKKDPVSCNVLCAGYEKSKCSSPTVELLSCSSWGLLLSRVGDDLMVYLLRYTSIFLPVPRGKHQQVGGPPISRLCFEMFKRSPKFGYWHASLYKCGAQKKRTRAEVDELTVEKQKRHTSYSTNGPVGLASSLGLTGVKSSMPLIRHHGSRNYDISVSGFSESTGTRTVIRKAESEGKQCLNCINARLGKRSRPFSWQRRRCRKQKQLTLEENSVNTHYNILPINTDCLHASFQCNEASLNYQEKMPWHCSCCSILQSLPSAPKRTDINRKSIFYNMESSLSVLPKKRIHH